MVYCRMRFRGFEGKEMTVYTLVSYKEHYHYDRYSEHFSSDWNIEVFENQEEIIKAIFDLKVKVREAIGEIGNDDLWEYKILIDGRRDDDWINDEHFEDPRFWEIESNARKLFDEWLAKAEERKEAKRLKEEAAKKSSDAAVAAAETRREKALLKTLKEKYPNE